MATILITGASSGFGFASAIALARRGDSVVATMRDIGKAEPLRAAGAGLPLDVIELDVTEPESRRAAIDQAMTRHGWIDVLINNAGVFSFGPAEVLGEADLRTQFETNVFAPFAMTAAMLPRMRARRSGRIVNVTSAAAFGVRPFMTGYSASKHALDALSSGMDREVSHFNVRVVSVAMVAFATNIARSAPAADTPYGETPIRSFEGFKSRLQSLSDLTPAVEAIVEAATSPTPKRRYLVAPNQTRFDAVIAEKEKLEDARSTS